MNETVTEDTDRKPARKRTVKRRKTAKTKSAAKKSPAPIKVDLKAALAYVRSKLRTEKDVFAIAFLEDEEKAIGEKIKAEEEARHKNLSITINKQTVKIGDHLFEVENYSGRYYGHYRGANYNDDIPRVVEYVVKDIKVPSEKESWRGKEISLSKVGGGHKMLNQHHYGNMYKSREAALDHAINETQEGLSDAQEQVDGFTVQLGHLQTLRRGEEIALPDPQYKNEGKRWTGPEKMQLRDMVKAGETLEALVEHFGRSRDTIVRKMHQLGIKDPGIPFHDFKKREAPPAIPAPEAIVQSEDFAEKPQPELATAS